MGVKPSVLPNDPSMSEKLSTRPKTVVRKDSVHSVYARQKSIKDKPTEPQSVLLRRSYKRESIFYQEAYHRYAWYYHRRCCCCEFASSEALDCCCQTCCCPLLVCCEWKSGTIRTCRFPCMLWCCDCLSVCCKPEKSANVRTLFSNCCWNCRHDPICCCRRLSRPY